MRSPRVQRLAADVAAEVDGAVDAFWADVRAAGGPLVEPLPGDDDHRLVTFVWRASAPDPGQVQLLGAPRWAPCDQQDSPHPMDRVGDTDIWYATFRVRADVRHRYAFFESPDGHAFSYPADVPLTDPANPATFPDDRSDPSVPPPEPLPPRTASAFALDRAPSERWLTRGTDTPAGAVTSSTFTSDVLGDTRRLWVYTPPGYSADADPYGLLLLHDGWEWMSDAPIAPILDNLVAAGAIPPLVAVLHESPTGRRDVELACHEPFAEAVATELVPWIRKGWAVTDDPAHTVVGGQSYGGLTSAFLALRHSDIFGNVLSQSGAFWFPGTDPVDPRHGWLIREYVRAARLPVRFWIDVGLLEGDMVAVNRRLRDVLEAKGYPVAYREFNSDHTWLAWRATIAEALVALTGDWPRR